ncbi:MAG: hypothetical protein QXF26_06640 [Candidatus Bathyarchaeia archaeon]
MAVRVKLRLKVKGFKEAYDAIALVNSGYEATTPQLLIPRRLAEELKIWPNMLSKAKVVAYGTAGGTVRNYFMPGILEVSIIEEDVKPNVIMADVVISEIEEEVLISDKLAGKLGIVLEDIGEGLYALREDPERKLRKSYPPQYW